MTSCFKLMRISIMIVPAYTRILTKNVAIRQSKWINTLLFMTTMTRSFSFYLAQGDSGGPLYVVERGTWYQIGLVSRGGVPSCSAPRQVVVYSRLSQFLDFIEKFVKVWWSVIPPVLGDSTYVMGKGMDGSHVHIYEYKKHFNTLVLILVEDNMSLWLYSRDQRETSGSTLFGFIKKKQCIYHFAVYIKIALYWSPLFYGTHKSRIFLYTMFTCFI